MSKKNIAVLILLMSISGIAQNSESTSDFNKFTSIKNVNRAGINNQTEKLIIANDTLVLIHQINNTFRYPDFPTQNEGRSFLRRYPYIAFGSYQPNEEKKQYFSQWSVPIVVFIDKSYAKKERVLIENFVTEISRLKIPNLNIEITKKKDHANYYITTTNDLYKTLDEKKLHLYSEERIKNKDKNNGTYYLQSDNNKKYYSCILKINISTFENNNDAIGKIKKLFFGSLGHFFPIWNPKESLLSTEYENINTILDFDINILKTHYSYIFPYKLEYSLFNQLEQNKK